MTEKNNIKAFPRLGDEFIENQRGMSLRDYFAAKAMEGMIMTQTYNDDAIAKYAYQMADAMLKAREE